MPSPVREFWRVQSVNSYTIKDEDGLWAQTKYWTDFANWLDSSEIQKQLTWENRDPTSFISVFDNFRTFGDK